MTISAFEEALSALLSLPKEERDRARAIAQLLSDQERVEFMRHLKELDGQIEAAEQMQEQFVTAGEALAVNTERHLAKAQRSGEEAGERSSEIASAEQSLSQS